MIRSISMAEIKLSEKEIQAAERVLRSGALRQGKECDAFEKEFCEHVGAKYAVTCANGSAALHLAYMACLQQGDEVLVPSFTFIATGSMATIAGCKPVFCDIEKDTFLINLQDAEQRITPKTRAIAPVHLFGNACDIGAIQSFAQRHHLLIIWDAAQAHGATYNNKDIGSFDDFVCYSFYPSKNMFVGEGGLICTNNPAYYERLRYIRTHGQTGKYYHTMMGLNYRMTDVEAAIGRQQLRRLNDMLEVRRRNASLLTDGLSDLAGITPQKATTDSRHAWHQYCVLIDPEEFKIGRDELAKRLNEKQIATGIHYPRGMHQQPIFQEMYGRMSLPITEDTCSKIIALPVHHGLRAEDIMKIVEAIHAV